MPELILARKQKKMADGDDFWTYQTAFFQGMGNYGSGMWGKGTVFWTKKTTFLLQVMTEVNCLTPTGGICSADFSLHSLSGTGLTLIKKVTASVTTYQPGINRLYCPFNIELPEDNYVIVVDFNFPKSRGTWEILEIESPKMSEVESDSDFIKEDTILKGVTIVDNDIGAYEDYVNIQQFLCDQSPLSRYTQVDNGFQLLSGVSPNNARWLVYASKPCADGEKAGFKFTRTFDKPGQIIFRRFVNAPPAQGELVGNSFGRFIIDGRERAKWIGTNPWQIFDSHFFVGPGTHTFEWSYEQHGSKPGSMQVGGIEIFEFDELPVDITDYTPPAPILTTNTIEILRGYNQYDRMGYGGTAIKFTAIAYRGIEYLDLIRNLADVHIFIDEHGMVYGGVFEWDELDIKKYGAESIYYVPLTLKCAQKAGVGS